MLRSNIIASVLMTSALTILASGCFKPEMIRFYDDGTTDEKAQLHNAIAQFIIEKGFGHNVSWIPGDPKDATVALTEKKVDIAFAATPAEVDKESSLITVGKYRIRAELRDTVPEVIAFLEKMKIEDDWLVDAISWRDSNSADNDNAVLYFLLNYQSKWNQWMGSNEFKYTKEEMGNQMKISSFKDVF